MFARRLLPEPSDFPLFPMKHAPNQPFSGGRRSGFLAQVAWGLAVLALAVAAAGGAWAQEVGASARLFVEVLDERGRPAELDAADLEVREAGETVPVTGLEPPSGWAGDARVVLYFDRILAGGANHRLASGVFADLAERLVELGEVELVSAFEEPELQIRTGDALALGGLLSRGTLSELEPPRILEIRSRALRELAASGLSTQEAAEVVTAAVLEERELIRERWQQLLAWVTRPSAAASGGVAAGPRILFLVADGFDLEPTDFYADLLTEEAMRGVLRGTSRLPPLAGEVAELARALAGAGWTVVPVALGAEEGEDAVDFSVLESTDQQGTTTALPGITIRPGSIFRRRGDDAEAELPAPRLLAPREPLRELAGAAGGEVVVADAGLRDAVDRLAGRHLASYRSRLPIGAGVERMEVLPRRPSLRVRARRWLTPGVPEEVAEVRLRRLLAGVEAEGGFDVAAVMRLEGVADEEGGTTGALEARLDLRDLEAATPAEEWARLDGAALRVSVAVAGAGEPRVRHEVLTGQNLRDRDQWTYRTRIDLPADATDVAVLVEELHRGHWGGRRATVVQGDSLVAGGELLPSPTVIEVARPEDEVLRGRVKLETRVYDPAVAAVDFLLDDRRVARETRPPFAARVDLGRVPRRRELVVIAYGADGAELGRDAVILNGGRTGLAVEIVRPEEFTGTGPVEVEAEVAVPIERRLDRVLFFWNNEPVATLYAPPFRQRVVVPEDRPVGYVRVVAMLDDGTVAEDVRVMNGPAASERLEVNLVELYVVVAGPDGRPVRGLTADDFRVREDGTAQEIATFSDASTLPLTLGMAIDSSASMFVKLPGVQEAATRFLDSIFATQDRAFLVDFDSEPRLARGLTGELPRLTRSISNLEANGRTALWESIVFSLVQLQGVPGRKALIVFSDGADEDDQFPFRSALDVAREMGVPIYLILMRKEPDGGGLNLFSRSFSSRADRLAEATGGRVFYAKEYDTLDSVYDEIEEELRSQYLLGYYPREGARDGAWRRVQVEVEGEGLTPRTLSGYWQ